MLREFRDLRFLQKQYREAWLSINPCLMRLLPDSTNQLEVAALCGFLVCQAYEQSDPPGRREVVLEALNKTVVESTVDAICQNRAALPSSFPSRPALLEAMRFAIDARYPEYAAILAGGDPEALEPWVAIAHQHLRYQSERCCLAMPMESAATELGNAARAVFTFLVDRLGKRYSHAPA